MLVGIVVVMIFIVGGLIVFISVVRFVYDQICVVKVAEFECIYDCMVLLCEFVFVGDVEVVLVLVGLMDYEIWIE